MSEVRVTAVKIVNLISLLAAMNILKYSYSVHRDSNNKVWIRTEGGNGC